MDIHSDGEREQGPSWARANWPLVELDEVNQGLDPTLSSLQVKVAEGARDDAKSAGRSAAEVERAANDAICAMMQIGRAHV